LTPRDFPERGHRLLQAGGLLLGALRQIVRGDRDFRKAVADRRDGAHHRAEGSFEPGDRVVEERAYALVLGGDRPLQPNRQVAVGQAVETALDVVDELLQGLGDGFRFGFALCPHRVVAGMGFGRRGRHALRLALGGVRLRDRCVARRESFQQRGGQRQQHAGLQYQDHRVEEDPREGRLSGEHGGGKQRVEQQMVDGRKGEKDAIGRQSTQAAQIANVAKKYMCMSICSDEPVKP
jgi:hypothetical protein